METNTYFDNVSKARPAKNQDIRAGIGHPVSSYLELAKKIAELQFRNRHHVLLFRGQKADYRTTKNNSMLKASIFRLENSKVPDEHTLVKDRVPGSGVASALAVPSGQSRERVSLPLAG